MTAPDETPASAFDADAVIDAMGPSLGLVIDPAYRAGVAAFLGVAARMARIVHAAPFDPEGVEPANVFRPGTRGGEPTK